MKKLRKEEVEDFTVDLDELKPYIKNKAHLKFVYDIIQMLRKMGASSENGREEARDILRD